MKLKDIYNITFFLLVTSVLFACSSYQKILKSSNYDKKYEAAKEYYNKEDYTRALPLFEELVNIYKGTDKAQKLYYYYVYCYYGMGDYVLARHHFRNYSQTFSNSESAEECQFMYAKCFKLTSPVSSLDQSNTVKAIDAFQLFINMYPQSSRIKECNGLIDQLRLKLEDKAFSNAELYFKLGNFKAAIIALKNVKKDYPDIDKNEDIDFLILKSSYLYAQNSVEEKQEERFREAIGYYENFIDAHAGSSWQKDAESIYDGSLKFIQIN